MSLNAGSILLLNGNNVVDRLQGHGLGDVRVPVDTIRETGNVDIVEKVPTEADFSFTLEGLDTSIELEAFLTGQSGSQASASSPGAGDPDGTEYKVLENCQHVNLPSPWKDASTGSAGVVGGGHLIPGYYLTRIRYRFGVTDNAVQEAELTGGSFYYGRFAPREEQYTGNGVTTAFATTDPAIRYRKGGHEGTTFRSVFGVLVSGVPQTEGVDYTVVGGAGAPGSVATVTFLTAPANGAVVKVAYFTSTQKTYPKSVHASTVTKPGAVRGRNICVSIATASGSSYTQIGGIQSVEVEGSIDGELEREFCNEDPTGRRVDGFDVNGTVTLRARDIDRFFDVMSLITGITTESELIGWLNTNQVKLKIEIQNPKNPGAILKTLWVDDAVFQIPGTGVRVNSPIDFAMRFESNAGHLSVYKGAKA
jgi:hypothetical protein